MKAQIWRGPTLVFDSGHISVRAGQYVWSAAHNPLAEIVSPQDKLALYELSLRAHSQELS